MRIVLISDTHGLHELMTHEIPKGDVLIHAGDCTNVGSRRDVEHFTYWFQNIKGFDTKIFIAGNHDMSFESRPDWLPQLINDENLSQDDCVYLEDDFFIIESDEFSRPIKFYGSPWQPEFMNWAFNLPRSGEDLEHMWSLIPDDTDVLITHSPPHGCRDVINYENVGCELLRFRVEQIKPALHVFGHVHDSYGGAVIRDQLYVNASICNEQYAPVNKPIIIDLTEVDGKIIATYVEE